MAVAEAAIWKPILTVEMEAIHTVNQDKRDWSVRNTAGGEVLQSPYCCCSLAAKWMSSWVCCSKRGFAFGFCKNPHNNHGLQHQWCIFTYDGLLNLLSNFPILSLIGSEVFLLRPFQYLLKIKLSIIFLRTVWFSFLIFKIFIPLKWIVLELSIQQSTCVIYVQWSSSKHFSVPLPTLATIVNFFILRRTWIYTSQKKQK